MAQKSTKPHREQNGIKIDMNAGTGQITDQHLNVRWLRNRAIPAMTPQVPCHISDLSLSVSLQSSFSWSNTPQESHLQVQHPISVEKPTLKAVTIVGKGI